MKNNNGINIGWSRKDITPDRNVFLAGQFHVRISEGVMDPVTATAMSIESAGSTGKKDQAVMVSCDLVTVSNELRDMVRERIRKMTPDLDPENVFLGATHTHTAPNPGSDGYKPQVFGIGYDSDMDEETERKAGMALFSELNVMPPAEYIEFASGRIACAVSEAWKNRRPSGISYGLGHAVIGRNRRISFKNGSSIMYGKASSPDFSHVEGYEDHSVYAMMTYEEGGKLTGIVANIPCPSQVIEHLYMISADYWHNTRREIRRRFGGDIYVMGQCAPAGDQSPHLLVGRRAEERMWRLKGRNAEENAPREEIAHRIADAIEDILPYAGKEIDWNPGFRHRREIVDLPRRMISEKDVEKALEESLPHREKYMKLAAGIEKNPGTRKEPRWCTGISSAYRLMKRGERVRERLETQKKNPAMPIELHVMKIGETVFATNPFELYIDYAVKIRELSKATQTFLVQKAGCSGTYLPSRRSIACGGYGSVPASTDIGPEGGDLLVEWTVSAINGMFDEDVQKAH